MVEGYANMDEIAAAEERLREREREACTCGLIAVGYRDSWAVHHVDACPAAALFTGYKIVAVTDA